MSGLLSALRDAVALRSTTWLACLCRRTNGLAHAPSSSIVLWLLRPVAAGMSGEIVKKRTASGSAWLFGESGVILAVGGR